VPCQHHRRQSNIGSLNLAIEGSRELSDFLPFVEELYLNVRQVPGCTPSEYAAAVLALLDAGSIRLYFDTRDQDEVRPDRSMVEAVLTRRLQLPYTTGRLPLRKTDPRRPPPEIRAAEPDLRMELTALGGEVWEKRAEPDWSRYVQTLTGEESGEAWSGDEGLLIACLGWYEELNSRNHRPEHGQAGSSSRLLCHLLEAASSGLSSDVRLHMG
jgi:hypothetical protein